jgi:hypothetical protein
VKHQSAGCYEVVDCLLLVISSGARLKVNLHAMKLLEVVTDPLPVIPFALAAGSRQNDQAQPPRADTTPDERQQLQDMTTAGKLHRPESAAALSLGR